MAERPPSAAELAQRIVQEMGPRTVLDAGCAVSSLVEALLDQGVEASGVGVSRRGSLTKPFPRDYDLIVCIGGLEALPAREAERAVANICGHTSDVLFAASARPAEHWAGLFARHGFVRDVDADPGAYLQGWAARFRRSSEPLTRVVAGYERWLAPLVAEVAALRQLAEQNRAREFRAQEAGAELEQIRSSAAWRLAQRTRGLAERIPLAGRRLGRQPERISPDSSAAPDSGGVGTSKSMR